MRLKPLMIGVDPGTTVGLAFLDMYGKVLDVESGKNLSVNDIIWEISQQGSPVIISTDRRPVPKTIKKIAANFDCKIYTPPASLKIKEKVGLTRGYGANNSHEKDALAAVLKAYNYYSAKLRQIEKQEKKNFERNVKARLFGERIKPEPKIMVKKKIVYREKPLKEYVKKIEKYEREIKKLKVDLEDQEKKVSILRMRIDELKKGEGELYLKNKILRLERKKRKAEERINEFAKALKNEKLRIMTRGKKRYTEDKSFFDRCKKKGESCLFVKILYEDEEDVYYEEIDSFEGKSVKLEEIVEKYRKKRNGHTT